MVVFVVISIFLALMLACGLLFAASASLRSLVRQLMPSHESALILPGDEWYAPQNVLGNLRPIAIFRPQPEALMSSQAFRVTLFQVRILAATILVSLGGCMAFLIYRLAA